MVIAPEHPLIDKYADRITNMDAIKAYREACAKKTEFERTQLVKEKTGVCIQGLELSLIHIFTILEYIDSCETSSPIIYKKGRKGNDIKSGTAEYT